MNDENLEIAVDAWLEQRSDVLPTLGVSTPADLIVLATHARQTNRWNVAHRMYMTARKECPDIVLRGDARKLASRTRKRLREELSIATGIVCTDLHIESRTDSPRGISVMYKDGEQGNFRAWWTEEDAMASAGRRAWERVMSEAIEVRRDNGSNELIDRKLIEQQAQELQERLTRLNKLGEILGAIGPLQTTLSGFVFVEDF